MEINFKSGLLDCQSSFRSLEEICVPAYLGTLETSIPRMKDISPILVGTFGGEECWGGGALSSGGPKLLILVAKIVWK